MGFAKNAERTRMGVELSSPTNTPDSSSVNLEQPSVSCPHCETVMSAKAAFCPGCAWSMAPLPPSERAAAALAYFTFVPAAVLLLLPAHRSHRFIRFHAWQSILL